MLYLRHLAVAAASLTAMRSRLVWRADADDPVPEGVPIVRCDSMLGKRRRLGDSAPLKHGGRIGRMPAHALEAFAALQDVDFEEWVPLTGYFVADMHAAPQPKRMEETSRLWRPLRQQRNERTDRAMTVWCQPRHEC